jgi:putative ABC transport system permease protein
MILDYFKLALANITHKGIRSWLTMLGIFIGIAAVVSLISLGQGMDDAIRGEFSAIGSNTIILMPGNGFQSFGSAKFYKHDEDLLWGVRGVDNIAPFKVKQAKVTFNREVKYINVNGAPADDRYKVIEDIGVKIAQGRRPQASDKYKAFLGSRFPTGDVFKNRYMKVGDKMDIDGYEFQVLGILESMGNPHDDETIWIPIDTAEQIYNDKGYNQFLIKVKEGIPPAQVAEDIKRKLRRDRNQKAGEEDFTVQTSDQLLESVGSILSSVQAVLIGIAAISLMVGGIGIMNTMYTSVLERTREIGLLKAVGAKNRDIMWMFLIESGVMGVVGGVVGVAIGLAMSKSVEYYAQNHLDSSILKASTSPWLIAGAITFSFIVGALSGVMPAIQASKLKPVEALRYE